MNVDDAFDGLMGALRVIERAVLVKHREKYHPLVWLERAEACGLITKEQAAACREAAAPLIARLQALEGVR
jgi:hypothetical protein